jgi:type III restriction enzyme
MTRRKLSANDQLKLLEACVKTAPCVPAIRKAVAEWRDGNYKGATDTSHLLLNYWFKTDHKLPNGQRFTFYHAQREAIETLIYLYEVARVRRHKDLLERFSTVSEELRLLQYDEFARYCVKMATGSGKTKVMALAIAWKYFNAVAEGRDDYAKTSLLIAPNVIVFERLRTDFANGRIPDVSHKDRAAQLWCENATQLTETFGAYLKVLQTEFEELLPTEFSDLLIFAQ